MTGCSFYSYLPLIAMFKRSNVSLHLNQTRPIKKESHYLSSLALSLFSHEEKTTVLHFKEHLKSLLLFSNSISTFTYLPTSHSNIICIYI